MKCVCVSVCVIRQHFCLELVYQLLVGFVSENCTKFRVFYSLLPRIFVQKHHVFCSICRSAENILNFPVKHFGYNS